MSGQSIEETQYLEESTVVQESTFAPGGIDPGESAIQYEEHGDDDSGLPGGNAEGLKKAKGGKAGSNKLLIGAVAMVVILALGAIYAKKSGALDPQQSASIEAPVEEMANPSLDPGPAQALAPVASTMPEPATAATPAFNLPPGQDGTPTAAPRMPAEAAVETGQQAARLPAADAPAPQVPVLAANPQVSQPVAQPAADPRVPELEATLRAERDRTSQLSKRLGELEAQLASIAPHGAERAAVKTSAQQSTTNKVARKVAQPKPKRIAKKAKASTTAKPAAPSIPNALVAQYNVSAIRNGVAWIDTPTGLTAVRVGDDLDGIGRVSNVDEDAWRVVAAGVVIK